MEQVLAASSFLDGCPEVPAGLMAIWSARGVVLGSMRSNLACEVTDKARYGLPLSTGHGRYPMLVNVATTGTSLVTDKALSQPVRAKDSIERHPVGTPDAGLCRRQISRMNSLFPDTPVLTLCGLNAGKCRACLPPHIRGTATFAVCGKAPSGPVVVHPNQRTADVGELLEHCPGGFATRQVRGEVTVKTMMPGTGSGRLDLVPLRDRARNEQAAVAA